MLLCISRDQLIQDGSLLCHPGINAIDFLEDQLQLMLLGKGQDADEFVLVVLDPIPSRLVFLTDVSEIAWARARNRRHVPGK